jgi:2,4-dienoyl-CoA reductase-like NADH-dependent reductase (Old Yellow Enzyme family)
VLYHFLCCVSPDRAGLSRKMPELLFTPGRIGEVEIRNRIVMPAMTTRLADADGFVTDATIAWFEARARGGAGLVTVEMASPEKAGRHRRRELGIYDDRFLPGLTRLAARLHEAGARAAIQLGHGGGHTRPDVCGETPLAPSAIPYRVLETTVETVVPLAMTAEHIEATIAAHVAAARRAGDAGFDMVELQACHGYLISQFLNPVENRRGDAYGGTLENRARFLLDILRRLQQALPGFPVVVRLGADDFFPGGLVPQEGVRVARWVAEAGAAAVHVSAGHYRSLPSAERMIPPMAYPEGCFLPYSARIRSEVAVPVIAVGRLGDPVLAEAALAEGKADFVALGRPLIADPDWGRKVGTGASPRRCIACNTCIDGMRGGASIHCLVNPWAGRETLLPKRSPLAGERICVIGAGPAGLSYAACVAEDNDVSVFERAKAAGGAFRLAGKAPLFQNVGAREGPLLAFVEALEHQCRADSVTFRFGVDPLREPGALDGFDRIVIATGAAYPARWRPVVRALLRSGVARRWPLRPLLEQKRLREWFYHRARRPTGPLLAQLLPAGPAIEIIGDARRVGRAPDAIESAVMAALHPFASACEQQPEGPSSAA